MCAQPSPTQLQQLASDPSRNVWVSANAGSGKTKVLVDRVLRLLLSGERPGHILCLTYTKAAATEMQQRIITKARTWATLDDKALQHALIDLSGSPPTKRTLERARCLCIGLMDATPPLRITTLHAFCEGLIGQFPYEAGIAPHIRVIEEQEASQLSTKARSALYENAHNNPDAPLSDALDVMAASQREHSFHMVLDDVISNKQMLWPYVATDAALTASISALYNNSDIETDDTMTSLQYRYLRLHEPSLPQRLLRYAEMLEADGMKTNVALAITLRKLSHPEQSATAIHKHAEELLKNDGFPKQPTQKFSKKSPDVTEEINVFLTRCADYIRAHHLWGLLRQSKALLTIAHHYLRHYTAIKMQRGVLDFDDLTIKALALLEDERLAPWILYKLDGNIHHLLLDEAQDTSGIQWRIVRCLTEEFFAGLSAGNSGRSLFVVGDEKQSIFSFQGAAPKEFARNQAYYGDASVQSGRDFARVPMQTSFRSAPAILALVDHVFSSDDARNAIGGSHTEVTHYAWRAQAEGHVYLYPALTKEASDEDDTGNTAQQSCKRIAAMVAEWLEHPRMLSSTGAPIQPGDILILLRSRTGMLEPLMRALRSHGVPVAGRDRFTPAQHIAVKDMLALCKFLLEPGDDMALACVLTSPIGGCSHDAVGELAAGRPPGDTLWQALKDDARMLSLCDRLETYQRQISHASLYRFFSELLYTHDLLSRYHARMGEDVRDALAAFLHLCAEFEASQPVSLQGFVDWMERNKTEMKRELHGKINAVRIMTIHGAKGLEAPVVIMPETIPSASGRNNPLLTTPDTVIYKTGDKKKLSGIAAEAYTQQQQARNEESLRLLYVALTRACDELHICGHVPGNTTNVNPDSWYARCRQAMETLGAQPIDTDAQTPVLHYASHVDRDTPAPPLSSSTANDNADIADALHLHRPISRPDDLLRFSYPSTHVAHASQQFQPMPAEDSVDHDTMLESSASIGTLVHQCLEYQTNRSMAWLMDNIATIIALCAPGTPRETIAIVTQHLRHLADSPDICALLEQPACAEVPVIGTQPPHDLPISGQIDRLIINKNSVYIIDIKTGVFSPTVAAGYHGQMMCYQTLIGSLYPQHHVKSACLFTNPHAILYDMV